MTKADSCAERVRCGDSSALAEAFDLHRARLRRTVHFRMPEKLRGRIDADDVLQDAYLSAQKRHEHLRGDDETSLFVWLRLIVLQTLTDAHRMHLGSEKRNADREKVIRSSPYSQATTFSLAASLLGRFTSPTLAARKSEMSEQLRSALENMDPIDREVLALRHFEEMSNTEVAAELGIQQKAASIRYVRALGRFKDLLESVPGFTQNTRQTR
ncbi:MAG: hypothetical protein DHS20C16_33910 [Phycisphaerae bacterium]|nr:MAG: hypothetical protein DHS20C16_33910 [Phycisphaerae bacterium]